MGRKALVHNCPRLPTIVVILWRKFPLERGPKRPQKCTIMDDCARMAGCGRRPPFESPHLDFPDFRGRLRQRKSTFKRIFVRTLVCIFHDPRSDRLSNLALAFSAFPSNYWARHRSQTHQLLSAPKKPKPAKKLRFNLQSANKIASFAAEIAENHPDKIAENR